MIGPLPTVGLVVLTAICGVWLLRLEGMATTIYHIFEDSVYQGKNQASGDTITMNFGENDIEKIFISGGSEGTYTPDSTGADMDGPVIYKSEDIE